MSNTYKPGTYPVVLYEADRRFKMNEGRPEVYRIKGRWYSIIEAIDMVEQLQKQIDWFYDPSSDGEHGLKQHMLGK